MASVIDPVLLDFPDHFDTERLLIRAPRQGDGAALNAAIAESLDELRAWMPWARDAQTPDDSEAFARRKAAQWLLRQDLMLFLFRKTDGMFVGGSGLHRMDWDVPRFEIGYWVRTSLRGQGYITEAVKGIAGFAFELLHAERLEIRCDARNHRSAAVAERAGFALEGRFPRDSRDTEGGLRDTLVYGRVRDNRASAASA